MKDWDRYAHEVVFGAVSSMHQVRDIIAQNQKVPSDIEALVSFDWKSDKTVFHYTLRVALLYSMWQRNLDLMISNQNNAEFLKPLHEMKRCAPDGVFTDIPHAIHCRLYRICPWCRYRKALEVLKRMGKHLKQTKQIAVTQFSSSGMMTSLDVEGNRKIIEATCKKRNQWSGDYVITLPAWLQDTRYINQLTPTYTPVWETSIIVFDNNPTTLILPENAITPKARKKHEMHFSTAGGWVIWKNNTKNSLSDALKYAMEYPLYLISKQMDPIESLFALGISNQLRAVGHGILR